MKFEELITNSYFNLPSHKSKLLDFIRKNFPHGVYKNLYSRNIDPYILYQGDVIKQIPVCFIDKDGNTQIGLDTVALVSNTCDMQHNRQPTIIVSPIIELSELSHMSNDYIKDLKNNNIFRYFYLPPAGRMPESCVDFARMSTLNNVYINNLKSTVPHNCIISLSGVGFYLFLIKLTYHLARTEG